MVASLVIMALWLLVSLMEIINLHLQNRDLRIDLQKVRCDVGDIKDSIKRAAELRTMTLKREQEFDTEIMNRLTQLERPIGPTSVLGGDSGNKDS